MSHINGFDDLAFSGVSGNSANQNNFAFEGRCQACNDIVPIREGHCTICHSLISNNQNNASRNNTPGTGPAGSGTGTGTGTGGALNSRETDILSSIFALSSSDYDYGLPSFIGVNANANGLLNNGGLSPLNDLFARLMNDPVYNNIPPTSKQFLEELPDKNIKLDHSHFIQLALRINIVNKNDNDHNHSVTNSNQISQAPRDFLPTVALFGVDPLQFHFKHSTNNQDKNNQTNDKNNDNDNDKNNSNFKFLSHFNLPALFANHQGTSISNPHHIDVSKEGEGIVVLLPRGEISFGNKCLNAFNSKNFNTKLCIVIQSDNTWPYTMTDSTNTTKDEKLNNILGVPCVMISQRDGEALKKLFDLYPDKIIKIELLTRQTERSCAICRDDYEVGSSAVELPCHHFYCYECIVEWLKKNSKCPLCRYQLPMDKSEAALKIQEENNRIHNQTTLHGNMFS